MQKVVLGTLDGAAFHITKKFSIPRRRRSRPFRLKLRKERGSLLILTLEDDVTSC